MRPSATSTSPRSAAAPFTDADTEVARALAAVAGLAITNARLAERSETRHRWGQAATEMATALLSGADPDDVLRAVSTRVSDLTGADMAGALTPSVDDDGTLTIVAAVGRSGDDVEGVRVPLAGSYVGPTLSAGKPRLIEDISTMPVVGRRAAVVIELTTGYGPAMIVPWARARTRAARHAPPSGCAPVRRPRPGVDGHLRHPRVGRPGTGPDAAAGAPPPGAGRPGPHRPRPARPRGPAHLRDGTVPGPPQPGPAAGAAEAAERLCRIVDELDGTMAEIRAAIFELHQEDGPEPATVRSQLADVIRQVTEGHDFQRDVRFRGPVDDLPRELVPGPRGRRGGTGHQRRAPRLREPADGDRRLRGRGDRDGGRRRGRGCPR